MRRWQVAVLAVLGALALACEGTSAAAPSPSGKAKAKAGMPASMAALGDSITAGFGSCATLLACGRNSWATGTSTSVNSHYLRIRDANSKIDGNAHNHALPGATAADMVAQATAAVKDKAEYVTILVGANDACASRIDWMTDPATFRAQIDAALAVLEKGLPKAHILVVSIPDLYRLWQLGHTDPEAVRAWNLLGTCPSLLADPTSSAAADETRRRQFADRVDAYDHALSVACQAYGRHCRFDQGAAHGVRFTLALVNHLDYFHPDADGERRLSEATYPGTFTW